ncbi:MAG: DUF547 domain-containing protein [Pseudomonadota bacterium]
MRALLLTATLASLFVTLPLQAAPDAEPWSLWDQSDEANPTSIEHAAWGEFLASYVVEDGSGVNKVTYSRVSATDRQALRTYIDTLTAIDPRTLRKAEQLAYWINLYNALTVDVVLRNPGKGSILRMGTGLLSIGPWGDPLLTIAGEEISLNDIEHRILRSLFADPRIHYAINCASLGCPNLLRTAYTADTLDELLARGERDFINHERSVAFDARGRLRLSKIFSWYADDFAADESELLAYIARHHETLGDEVARYEGKVRYHYDWNLNAAQ